MGRMSSNYQHNSYEQEKPEPNERNSQTASMSDDVSKDMRGKDGTIRVTRIKNLLPMTAYIKWHQIYRKQAPMVLYI